MPPPVSVPVVFVFRPHVRHSGRPRPQRVAAHGRRRGPETTPHKMAEPIATPPCPSAPWPREARSIDRTVGIVSAKYLRHLTHRVVTRRCAMLAELSPKRHPWGLGSPNRLFGATHRSTNEISSNRMAAFVLPFEKPVVDLVDRVRHLRELAQNDAKFEPELLQARGEGGSPGARDFRRLVARCRR